MAISLMSASRCCTNEDLAGFLDVAVVVVLLEGRDVILFYFFRRRRGYYGDWWSIYVGKDRVEGKVVLRDAWTFKVILEKFWFIFA